MLAEIRSSPLFSVRRAVFTYCLALLIGLSDLWVIDLLGIDTPGELLTRTLVHGTGFYLGYTVIALFNGPTETSG